MRGDGNMNKTGKLFEQILTFGLAGKLKGSGVSGYMSVAAGDPSKVVLDRDASLLLPESFMVDNQHYRLDTYTVFKVTGSSMYPQGISDGDFILTLDLGANDQIHFNDYIVISVDRETYKKFEDSSCDFKLRKALITIDPDDNIDDKIEELKVDEYQHNRILLPKYQQRFKEKYNKTRALYHNDPLVASITYRDGELFYSFHPRKFVMYKAVFRARIEKRDTDWSSLS